MPIRMAKACPGRSVAANWVWAFIPITRNRWTEFEFSTGRLCEVNSHSCQAFTRDRTSRSAFVTIHCARTHPVLSTCTKFNTWTFVRYDDWKIREPREKVRADSNTHRKSEQPLESYTITEKLCNQDDHGQWLRLITAEHHRVDMLVKTETISKTNDYDVTFIDRIVCVVKIDSIGFTACRASLDFMIRWFSTMWI